MRKAQLFWPLLLALVLADCGSKRVAEENLTPHIPHEVVGEVVRFTLGYNPGAAFGLNVGDASRAVFITLTLVALVVLGAMYRTTPAEHRTEIVALALITGGALGNLVDRIRAGQVVDFIDVGIGSARFWTFNLADAGITVGALLLALSILRSPSGAGSEDVEPAGERR
jgi:signal peptidase II